MLQKELGEDCLVVEQGLNSRTSAFPDPIGPLNSASAVSRLANSPPRLFRSRPTSQPNLITPTSFAPLVHADAYNCNGRASLMVALHSAEPINVVVGLSMRHALVVRSNAMPATS